MGIKTLSGNYKGKFVRPTGYRYPLGLSRWANQANAATNTTGGTQTIDGSNTVHIFTSSGTFTLGTDATVEVLVVAGGGGGAAGWEAAGAGAGGLLYGTKSLTSGGYTVTIGAGGAGGIAKSEEHTSELQSH